MKYNLIVDGKNATVDADPAMPLLYALRSDLGLRLEEVGVPEAYAGGALGTLVPRSSDYVLVAVRAEGQWIFNPQDDFQVKGGNTLILMATPAGRTAVERQVGAAHAMRFAAV